MKVSLNIIVAGYFDTVYSLPLCHLYFNHTGSKPSLNLTCFPSRQSISSTIARKGARPGQSSVILVAIVVALAGSSLTVDVTWKTVELEAPISLFSACLPILFFLSYRTSRHGISSLIAIRTASEFQAAKSSKSNTAASRSNRATILQDRTENTILEHRVFKRINTGQSLIVR